MVIDDRLVRRDFMKKAAGSGRMQQEIFVKIGHGRTIQRERRAGSKPENPAWRKKRDFWGNQRLAASASIQFHRESRLERTVCLVVARSPPGADLPKR